MNKTKERTYNKPVTEVIDDQIKKGGEWNKIVANVNRIASRRDMNRYSKSRIISHIKNRLKNDPNFFDGKVEVTENEVKVNGTSNKLTDFEKALQIETPKSNKAVIYKAWKDGEEDVDKLHKLVNEEVKQTTIRSWLSGWKHDRGLPAVAKED